MNITRTALTNYVSRTLSEARASLSSRGSIADLDRFSAKLDKTSGDNIAEIHKKSEVRGLTRAVVTGLSGVALAGGALAAGMAIGGAVAIVGIFAASCLSVAGVAGASLANDREKDFRNTVDAFSRDVEAGRSPGIRLSSGSDDEWLLSPANPASPLSLVTPHSL